MQTNIKNVTKNKTFPSLTSFPYLASERSQKFFGVVLTLLALSFFGFFAIKPTISTILKLQKEVSDSQIVLTGLETKIKNLSELRKQYFSLQNDLTVITNAITIYPDAPVLFGQIQSIAQTSEIAIKKLQNSEVEILRSNKGTNKKFYSYSFTVAGSGTFENISKFLQTITDMERIVNIDSFSMENLTRQEDKPLEFTIQGTAYFKGNT
jgi:Tfp pilus assembly protein PilO